MCVEVAKVLPAVLGNQASIETCTINRQITWRGIGLTLDKWCIRMKKAWQKLLTNGTHQQNHVVVAWELHLWPCICHSTHFSPFPWHSLTRTFAPTYLCYLKPYMFVHCVSFIYLICSSCRKRFFAVFKEECSSRTSKNELFNYVSFF